MSTAGFSDQPVTGTVVGYRWWDLFLNGGGPRMWVEPSHPQPPTLCGAWARWEPGVNQAQCLAIQQPMVIFSMTGARVTSSTGEHPWHTSAPEQGCHCGYWAFWGRPLYWRTTEPTSVGTLVNGIVPILGVAEGWGRTLKGSLGFRCEYAKVTALLAPPAFKTLLSELQPQAMIYANPRAMFAEHPSGILEGNKTE